MCGNETPRKDWVNAKEVKKEQNEAYRLKHLSDIEFLNQNVRGKKGK